MNKLTGLCLALTLIAAFTSCKSKQSSYKSVYEAAKERELDENKMTTTTTTTTDTYPTSSPVYPVYNNNNSDVVEETVRTEKITPVYSSDASGLKAYSVVIASLSVKPNAEALKARMQQEGYNIILAQNDSGMYRVIIGSYDDKSSAVNQKNTIRNKFSSMGSTESLRKMYGIPFDDLWVLQRSY